MLMRTPHHRWVRPKRLQPPGFIVPCQPTLASTVPAGDGWIHELKHDGFRILAFKDGDHTAGERPLDSCISPSAVRVIYDDKDFAIAWAQAGGRRQGGAGHGRSSARLG